MKFNELSNMMQKPEPKPDTYEAGMALNQLLKIGTHAIKIHNMIDDAAEMESWVAKKIDLASNYVKSVHGYTAGSKAGTYDDDGMSEMKRMPKGTGTMQGVKEDASGWQLVSKAKDIAKKMAGNLTGAVRQIEKLQKDLSKNSSVQKALAQFNEDAGDKYFDYENSDEYADNVEKYGDVDKTPLTPQERQQFAKWLIDSANDYFERADEGVDEIGDDPYNLDDEQKKLLPKVKEFLKQSHAKGNQDQFADDVLDADDKFGDEDLLMNDDGYQTAVQFSQHAQNYTAGLSKLKSKGQDYTVKTIRGVLDYVDDDPHIASAMLVFQQDFEGTPLQKKVSRVQASESTSADSGELARLKELSGIKEDAGLTDEQKKGLDAIAKKYKDREGGNGDMLAYGYLDVSDTGIPTDGYDKEEMEAYSKKIGVDWREWDGQQSEDFLDQSETTGGATAFMIDDLIKVLGQNFMNDEKLQFSAKEYLDDSDKLYQPMPEGDEFDIEEDEDFEEVLGPLGFPEDETELFDAEYQGRKVPLNKPMRGDSKKFKVYVKDPKTGNVKKVNFGHGGTSAKKAGQKTMKIRKSNPKARKSFRARHNCANPGPKTSARYWSCKAW